MCRVQDCTVYVLGFRGLWAQAFRRAFEGVGSRIFGVFCLAWESSALLKTYCLKDIASLDMIRKYALMRGPINPNRPYKAVQTRLKQLFNPT